MADFEATTAIVVIGNNRTILDVPLANKTHVVKTDDQYIVLKDERILNKSTPYFNYLKICNQEAYVARSKLKHAVLRNLFLRTNKVKYMLLAQHWFKLTKDWPIIIKKKNGKLSKTNINFYPEVYIIKSCKLKRRFAMVRHSQLDIISLRKNSFCSDCKKTCRSFIQLNEKLICPECICVEDMVNPHCLIKIHGFRFMHKDGNCVELIESAKTINIAQRDVAKMLIWENINIYDDEYEI